MKMKIHKLNSIFVDLLIRRVGFHKCSPRQFFGKGGIWKVHSPFRCLQALPLAGHLACLAFPSLH